MKTTIKFFALAALCFASLFQVAWAIQWDKSKDFHWNAGTNKITAFPGVGTGNVWSSAAKGVGTSGPFGTYQKALPFGPSPYANFHAGFTPGNMAKALSPLNVIVTLVGAAIIDRALDVSCLSIGGTISQGPVWQECNYKTIVGQNWRVMTSGFTGAVGPSPLAACNDVATKYPTWHGVIDSSNGFCVVFRNSDNYRAGGASIVREADTSSLQRDGWKDSTPAIAETKLKPTFEAWTQADFTAGKTTTADTTQVMDQLFSKDIGVDASIWSDWQTNPLNSQTVAAGDPSTVEIKDAPLTTTTTTTDANGNPTTKTQTDQTTHKYKTDVPTNPGSVTSNSNINITHTTTNNTYNSSTSIINSSTVTVTSTGVTTAAPELKVCGMPGGPACKIDETGTITTSTMVIDKTAIETDQATKRDVVSGKSDKTFFDGYTSFFVTPPMANCVPIEMPVSSVGVQIPSIDPCKTVDGIRGFMAWLWAVGGLFLCVKFVREAI